jgi:hypothetical protein
VRDVRWVRVTEREAGDRRLRRGGVTDRVVGRTETSRRNAFENELRACAIQATSCASDGPSIVLLPLPPLPSLLLLPFRRDRAASASRTKYTELSSALTDVHPFLPCSPLTGHQSP